MFIERLKKLREGMHLNQKQMSEKLNLSYKRYNHYETGKREPDIDIIKNISIYFNVSTDYLLGLTDIPTPATVTDAEPTYSTEEQELIEKYRQLTPKMKESVKSNIDSYIEVLNIQTKEHSQPQKQHA